MARQSTQRLHVLYTVYWWLFEMLPQYSMSLTGLYYNTVDDILYFIFLIKYYNLTGEKKIRE